MLQSLKEAIDAAMTDPASDSIEWVHTTAEIVEGVEVVIEIVTSAGGVGAFSTTIASMIEGTAAGVALPVLGAAAGVAGEFAALGLGYAEAAKAIKERRSGIGFAYGVALGVSHEAPDFVKAHFAEWSPDDESDYQLEFRAPAQHYYNSALVLGYRYGYELNQDEQRMLWKDLARDPEILNTPDKDSDSEMEQFYRHAGLKFYRLHITDDGQDESTAPSDTAGNGG